VFILKYYVLFFAVLLSFYTLLPACVSKLPCTNIAQSSSDEPENYDADIVISVKIGGTVKKMPLEEWASRAVAYEAPEDAPEEFVKAMAVAMRTYGVYHLWQGDKRGSHSDCDFCSDSGHCKGLEANGVSETITAAVSATYGEIIYYDRHPINPIMHTSSAGMTASANEAMGQDVPYLQSVSTPDESDLNGFTSTAEFTKASLSALLVSNGYITVGEPKEWLTDIIYTPSGRVQSISVCGHTVSGNDFISMLGLSSLNFTVKFTDNRTTFEAKGIGSGVGLSKYGAFLMAKDDLSYKQILTHYYSGTTIGK